MASTALPKLPLWATVGATYRGVWANKREYFTIVRFWLLISAAILFAYNWLSWEQTSALLCLATRMAGPPNVAQQFFFSLPPSIFLALCVASIAVAWHRFILRREPVPTRPYLRLDKLVFTYFGMALALRLSLVVPFAATTLVSDSPRFTGLVFFVLLIVTLIACIRLTPVLPAVAIEKREVTLRHVWHRTYGNWWRLFLGTLLCTLPAGLLYFILRPACHDKLFDIAVYTLGELAGILITIPLTLTFLSLAYRHFFERDA